MLKTYRIIPFIFILFLFGFTLITGCGHNMRSPSEIASDPHDTNHPASPAARALQYQSGNSMQPVAPSDPSGGEVAQLNERVTELEAENARLLEQKGATANLPGGEVAQLNARITELEAENATLVRADAQRGAPNPLPDCDRLIDWLDPFFACDR